MSIQVVPIGSSTVLVQAIKLIKSQIEYYNSLKFHLLELREYSLQYIPGLALRNIWPPVPQIQITRQS